MDKEEVRTNCIKSTVREGKSQKYRRGTENVTQTQNKTNIQ